MEEQGNGCFCVSCIALDTVVYSKRYIGIVGSTWIHRVV